MKVPFFLIFLACEIFIGTLALRAQDDDVQKVSLGGENSPLMVFDFKKRTDPEGKEKEGEREPLLFNEQEHQHEREATDNENNYFYAEDTSADEKEPGSSKIKTEEPALVLKIFNRGYLKLDGVEFEAVAGPSRGKQSRTYNSLVQKIAQYQKLKTEGRQQEVLLSFLKELADASQKYILKKEGSLFKERQKLKPSSDRTERSYKRIDACNLLLNGITAERLRLDNSENTVCWSPLPGRRFQAHHIRDYQSNFAAGMISSLDRFLLNAPSSKEFVFKPELPNKQLTELNAKQLGFSRALIATGVTEQEANLLGRELATFKLAQLIGCKLVPEVIPTAIGPKGNQKIGNAQQYLCGEQLYEERVRDLSPEELTVFFGTIEQANEYLAEVASGASAPLDGWKLCFPDSLEEVSREKALLEKGKEITMERALELAYQGKLSFQIKELCSINHDIDLTDPVIQRSLSNIQLLHLITGELDPNLQNFIFLKDEHGHWKAYSIDHTFSFPSYFTEINDQFLEALKNEKLVRHVLKTPLLIDEQMGEAILALTPEGIESALEDTRLTTAEIEATKRRVVLLQQYIKIERDSGGYVRSPAEDQTEEDKAPLLAGLSHENFLVWGEKTYEILKVHPERSYLGKALEVKEQKEKELQAILAGKSRLNKRDGESEQKEKLASALQPNSHQISIFEFEGRKHSASESEADDELERNNSQTSEETKKTVLKNFTSAVENKLYYQFDYLRNRVGDIHRWPLFSPLKYWSSEILPQEAQQLIFNTNSLRSQAEQMEEVTRSLLAQLTNKNPLSMLNHDLWKNLIKQLGETETAWSNAAQALEGEQKSLPAALSSSRQSYFEEAKNKKEAVAIELLWAQVYHAEHKAKAALDQQHSYSQGALKKIGKAQQAWRILISNLTPFSRTPNSVKIWKKQFEIAASLKSEYSEFFSHWLKAIKLRHASTDPLLYPITLSEYKSDEGKVWDDFLNHVYKMIEAPNLDEQQLWNEVIQEISFQKLYLLAEQATTHVREVQQEVNWFAQDKIIQTETHIANMRRFGYPVTYVELMSVANIDVEKLAELCEVWEQLKKANQLEKKAWGAVIELASKLAPNKNFKHEKPLQDQNEQSRVAWVLFQARQLESQGARTKAKFHELDDSRAGSPFLVDQDDDGGLIPAAKLHRFQKAIDNSPLDQVGYQLKKIKNLCEENMKIAALCDLTRWKPTFPSVQLTRLQEMSEPGRDFLLVSLYEEAIMKSFFHQIDDFPHCLNYKTLLEEMLDGVSDEIKEEWDQSLQNMKALQLESKELLDRLALLRGFK
ncbi:MAG: hypothetical protein K2W97_02750 [Chthoniobacterales bacterium]|nr:hypothetical protein [Chthoniobacterales bacterium]